MRICCSEGLDYVIAQAEQYGVKLILTLSNYFAQVLHPMRFAPAAPSASFAVICS